jgi:hypothetical protein
VLDAVGTGGTEGVGAPVPSDVAVAEAPDVASVALDDAPGLPGSDPGRSIVGLDPGAVLDDDVPLVAAAAGFLELFASAIPAHTNSATTTTARTTTIPMRR